MKGQFIQIGLVAIAMMASVTGSVRAETDFRIAPRTECERAIDCLQLGNQLAAAGKYEVAIELYFAAMERDSREDTYPSLTRYNLGLAYQRTQQWGRAISIYLKAIEYNRGWGDKNRANAYNNLGVCQANLGKYNEALDSFENAIQDANSDAQRQQYQQNLEIVEQLARNN